MRKVFEQLARGGLYQTCSTAPRSSSEIDRVAVKELKLSYYIGETLLFTTYTHYGNLIYVP